MSKELKIMKEERERLVQEDYADCCIEECNLVIKALQRLEAIDNANPSEALECLGLLGDFEWHKKSFKEEFPDLFATIKQALLKAQEQDIAVKALKYGIYVKDMPREDLIKQFGLKLSNIETEWYLSNNIMCVNLKDYKTLFWLKEDKSE